MSLSRRGLGIVLACIVGIGALAFVEDVTTILLVPEFPHSASVVAFPGQLLDVELGSSFTSAKTSDPTVVAPLGGNRFVAARPGQATLSAASLRCPGCYVEDIVLRVTIEVRLPGT